MYTFPHLDLKSNFSPFQKKELSREPASSSNLIDSAQPKKGDYLMLTVANTPHKELNKKLQNLKEEHAN